MSPTKTFAALAVIAAVLLAAAPARVEAAPVTANANNGACNQFSPGSGTGSSAYDPEKFCGTDESRCYDMELQGDNGNRFGYACCRPKGNKCLPCANRFQGQWKGWESIEGQASQCHNPPPPTPQGCPSCEDGTLKCITDHGPPTDGAYCADTTCDLLDECEDDEDCGERYCCINGRCTTVQCADES